MTGSSPGNPTTSTASRGSGDERALAPSPVAHLFLLLECDRPLAQSTGYSLRDVSEVDLGRGDARTFAMKDAPGAPRLSLKVPDRRMSSQHARLTRVLERWVLEDADSKNGVVLNGVRQKRAVLSHGDVFALGHTFFLYAEMLVAPHEPPGEVLPTRYGPLAPELSTFNRGLAADFDSLAEVARAQVPVLLQGETGTGKEVLARAVHAFSRRAGPFVAINCGSLPDSLVESELFGHKKGAFTGASEDRPGLIRTSSGGTLFLDEIGDLPLPLQAALLRVLQEGEVLPVGASQPVKVELRVVAATHRDLAGMVERQQFRSDLYARLSGFGVHLPPLRSRREDLGLLLRALLPKVAPAGTAEQLTLSSEAAWALTLHPWPLNVRELEKALAVAAVLARGGRMELAHLPESVRTSATARPPSAPPPGPPSAQEDARRTELIALLREHKGNISAVARTMGLARMQIQRWLKRYQLDPDSFR